MEEQKIEKNKMGGQREKRQDRRKRVNSSSRRRE
jgi:hypothetical protein